MTRSRLCGSALVRAAFTWVLLFGHAGHAVAQELDLPPPGGAPEAWLVTYGPGEIYWQRFGHNAIWLREPDGELDHVFNFGYFDFRQEAFLKRFVMGRMLYFSAAQPALREFAQYQREQRSISVQPLNLAPAQYRRLRDHLVRQVQPEHRDYLYDYYLDNCSTRIRDALDVALDGAFASRWSAQPAGQNFRDHTRRSVASDFWYYLGLEAGLGRPVDRDISAWDEMFLPAKVAHYAAQHTSSGVPLTGPAHAVYAGAVAPPPDEPGFSWWRYLAAGLGLLLFFALLARAAGPVMAEGAALAWLLISASNGVLLAFLWWATDHAAAAQNFNILLFNPLFLLGLLPPLRRPVAWLMLLGLGVAALQGAFPGGQYNLDVVAFVAPLHLAGAWALFGKAAGIDPWFNPPASGARSRS
ncbi:MAG: DUF4105 domain-containing protein [Xanthomonadales bacterium]|nr:DUF4105 domain-containing protein [Xanthomonadales bacterium]